MARDFCDRAVYQLVHPQGRRHYKDINGKLETNENAEEWLQYLSVVRTCIKNVDTYPVELDDMVWGTNALEHTCCIGFH